MMVPTQSVSAVNLLQLLANLMEVLHGTHVAVQGVIDLDTSQTPNPLARGQNASVEIEIWDYGKRRVQPTVPEDPFPPAEEGAVQNRTHQEAHDQDPADAAAAHLAAVRNHAPAQRVPVRI